MPEYVETVVQATTSRRAFACHIQLPRANPAGRGVMFEEEEITVVGTKVTRQVSGMVSAMPLVATDDFPIVNPNTGVPTGQRQTYGQLYTTLMSAYADMSAKRDAAAAAAPAPAPVGP